MRLSRLARDLGISLSELLNFYKDANISKYTHPNNKASEEDVRLAFGHFKPGVNPFAVEEEETTPPEAEEIVVQEIKEEPADIVVETQEPAEVEGPVVEEGVVEEQKEEVETAPLAEEKSTEESSVDEDNLEEVEVIRPKLVKLEGIKVIGKIDLPEPIKKSEDKPEGETETSENEASTKPKKKGKKEAGNKEEPKEKKKYKPLTYEEKLKRDKERETRRLKREKREEKERKRKHYESLVQSGKNTTKPKKKKNIEQNARKKPVVKHKNPIRRFWAWLMGEYDRF